MRILQIGMLLPSMPSSGEDGYIKKLSLELIKQGHQVDVLTTIPSQQFKIDKIEQDGINYYIMNRLKPYMYHAFSDPMTEVYDELSSLIILDFFKNQLKNKIKYDLIIYHSMYPLSLIELVKNFTERLIFIMHGTYIINPLMHTYSAIKINENPFQSLRMDAFNYKHLTKEYHAMTKNNFIEIDKHIEKQMKERMDYGKYLLEQVIDLTISNGYFGLHAYKDFNVNPKNIRIIENPVNNKLTDEIIEKAEKRYRQSYDKYIYSYLSNWQYMKGQHILVKAFEKIKEVDNIECNLYGEMNINPQYKNLVADIIYNSNHLRKTVKLKGAYNKEEINNIFNEMYIHVNAQAWDIGQTGTFYETLMNGIMQIWNQSAHIDYEIEFKDAYYFENKIIDANMQKLYEFELKYAKKPEIKLSELYKNKLKNYIYKAGDYKELATKIKESIGKDHFENWLLLAKERERTVNYTYNDFINYLLN